MGRCSQGESKCCRHNHDKCFRCLRVVAFNHDFLAVFLEGGLTEGISNILSIFCVRTGQHRRDIILTDLGEANVRDLTVSDADHDTLVLSQHKYAHWRTFTVMSAKSGAVLWHREYPFDGTQRWYFYVPASGASLAVIRKSCKGSSSHCWLDIRIADKRSGKTLQTFKHLPCDAAGAQFCGCDMWWETFSVRWVARDTLVVANFTHTCQDTSREVAVIKTRKPKITRLW